MESKDIGRLAVEETKTPQPAFKNPLAVMQDGEEIIAEIKRHPFGIIIVYAAAALFIIALTAAVMFLSPSLLPNYSQAQIGSLAATVFIISTVLTTAFVFIVNKIYWGNHWIVTSDSITQIEQTSLFHKHSSQLSLESLEDVTAEQDGILTHIFHYGTLKAETAGEKSKFTLTYCPIPTFYAQKILAARETFEHKRHS